MTKKVILTDLFVVFLIFLIFSANAVWASETKKNVIKIKAGQLSPKTSDIIGIPVSVDSGVAWSLAWENRVGESNKVSMGISIDGATNDLILLGNPAGDLKTIALMLNGRYYIPFGKKVEFFVGGGLGFLSTRWTIPSGGKTDVSGFATQLLTGVEVYLADSFSIGIEGKYLYAKPDDAIGDYIDISGPGILATAGVHF